VSDFKGQSQERDGTEPYHLRQVPVRWMEDSDFFRQEKTEPQPTFCRNSDNRN